MTLASRTRSSTILPSRSKSCFGEYATSAALRYVNSPRTRITCQVESSNTSLSSAQRYDDSSVKLTLIWNQNQLIAYEREVSTHTTFDIADLLPHDMSEQTLLGFRCSVCGKANRKLRWEVASCLHCSASFTLTNKAIEKSLSRRRKMELSFTGSRSDLGKANMVLSDDDLSKRTVSTFTDGTRVGWIESLSFVLHKQLSHLSNSSPSTGLHLLRRGVVHECSVRCRCQGAARQVCIASRT